MKKNEKIAFINGKGIKHLEVNDDFSDVALGYIVDGLNSEEATEKLRNDLNEKQDLIDQLSKQIADLGEQQIAYSEEASELKKKVNELNQSLSEAHELLEEQNNLISENEMKEAPANTFKVRSNGDNYLVRGQKSREISFKGRKRKLGELENDKEFLRELIKSGSPILELEKKEG